MERTFRLAKRHRNLAIVCLIFFVLVGVASAYGIWAAAPEERRIYASYAAAFVGLFWAFWASLACWALFAYWREELKIEDRQVAQQGVIRRTEIDLGSLTNVVWSIFPRSGGKIILRTLTEKTTIYLGNFEPLERLWLIRFFRNELPTPLQQDWALFCSKIGLPLRDRDMVAQSDPGPDGVRIKRQRWDWYFIPVILLATVFGAVTYWKFQQPRMLVAPLMPTVFWLVLRAMTPRQGLIAKRMSSEPGMTGFLIFEAWWLGVAVAGLVIFRIWQPPMPHAVILGAIAAITWFAVLFWRAHQLDCQRRERDEANATIAVRQWDEGEVKRATMADEEM